MLHQWSALAAAAGGGVLVAVAASPRARLATLVYVLSLVAMLGVSAVYHRVWWRSPRARTTMRRLDHSAIFLVIAGTYTPFGLLVIEGTVAIVVLALVWGGGLAGVLLNVVWIGAPRWVGALVYLAVGWAGLVSLPQLWSGAGALVTVLVAIGGGLYTLGAVVYARRRPDPAPAVFGYHELFHALVVLAAAVHFAAVSRVVT